MLGREQLALPLVPKSRLARVRHVMATTAVVVYIAARSPIDIARRDELAATTSACDQ